MILIGALFIANKELAMSWGFILIGVFLIISGIIPMIMNKTIDVIGLIMIILGIVIIVVPGLFANLFGIVVGIIAIIVGLLMIVSASKDELNTAKIIGVIVGVCIIIAGITLILDWDIAYQLFGVFLIIAGAINIVGALKK